MPNKRGVGGKIDPENQKFVLIGIKYSSVYKNCGYFYYDTIFYYGYSKSKKQNL